MKQTSILTQYFYPSHASTAQLMTYLANGLSQHDYKLEIFTGTESNSATYDFSTQVKIIRAFSPIKSSASIFSKISSSIFFLFGAINYVLVHTSPNIPWQGVEFILKNDKMGEKVSHFAR